MTRKRFIKLCMAKGWSRNKATALAHAVHINVSYEKAMRLVDFVDCIISAGYILADSISTFSSEISDVLREAPKENNMTGETDDGYCPKGGEENGRTTVD